MHNFYCTLSASKCFLLNVFRQEGKGKQDENKEQTRHDFVRGKSSSINDRGFEVGPLWEVIKERGREKTQGR